MSMLDFFIFSVQIFAVILSTNLLLRHKLTVKLLALMTIFAIGIGFALGWAVNMTIGKEAGIVSLIPVSLFVIIYVLMQTKRLFDSVIAVVISNILLVSSIYIIQLVPVYFLDNHLELMNQESYYLGVTITAVIIFIILICVIGYIFDKFQFYKILKKHYGVLLLILMIITFFIFFINIFNEQNQMLTNEFAQINGLLFFLYTCVLFCVVTLFIRTYMKDMKLANERLRLEQLQGYTKKMEEHYEEMKKFRHDYRNILLGLSEYIRIRDMEGLEAYYSKKVEPINYEIYHNNHKLGLLKNIYVQEIKGLLASKLMKAQELKIDTVTEVVEPIKQINMDKVDLCRGLGIILDNAIEEAIECVNPTLRVVFIKKEHSVLILVTNSCRNNVPSQRKIYEQGFSTKGEGRGLGLSNLEEVVEKRENIHLDTYIEQEVFVQQLEIFEEE